MRISKLCIAKRQAVVISNSINYKHWWPRAYYWIHAKYFTHHSRYRVEKKNNTNYITTTCN